MMGTEDLLHRPIGAYYDSAASGAPTPGGGSVAGVCAALGAALGQMVVRLSEGKKACADAMPALEAARATLESAARTAFHAAAADEQVYGRYRAASSLPRGTGEEQAARAAAIEEALVAATETPVALCRACLGMLPALETVARHGTIHALSDARLGAYLAEAAIKGALLNVRGNAAMMKNRDAAAGYETNAAAIESAARTGAAAVESAAVSRS